MRGGADIPYAKPPAVCSETRDPDLRRVVPGPPVPELGTMYLEIANTCNSLCETCPLTFGIHEHAAFLSFEEVKAMVEQAPDLRRAVLHGVGEPLLNPALPEMVGFLTARGVATCFNTNGLLLTPDRADALIDAGLSELRVSLDAAEAETYRRIRGVRGHAVVVRNLARFVAKRDSTGSPGPAVTVYFTAMRENIEELPRVLRIVAEAGAEALVVQRMTFFDMGLATADQSLFRSLEENQRRILAGVEEEAGRLGVELIGTAGVSPLAALEAAPPRQGCRRPWTTTYVTAQGSVLSCCIAPFTGEPLDSLILGNVFDSPLSDIWSGPPYEAVRRGLSVGPPVPACEGCGERWSY